jgi:hypothetical protein
MATRKKPVEPEKLTVVAALERDLQELGRRQPGLDRSALAASALSLAAELDSAQNSATSKSMCARALREVWDRLQELAPAQEEGDQLDDLAKRRDARLGRPAS